MVLPLLLRFSPCVAGERNVLESFLGTVEQQFSAQGVREQHWVMKGNDKALCVLLMNWNHTSCYINLGSAGL